MWLVGKTILIDAVDPDWMRRPGDGPADMEGRPPDDSNDAVEDRASEQFHLQGQHDQKTHGNRQGAHSRRHSLPRNQSEFQAFEALRRAVVIATHKPHAVLAVQEAFTEARRLANEARVDIGEDRYDRLAAVGKAISDDRLIRADHLLNEMEDDLHTEFVETWDVREPRPITIERVDLSGLPEPVGGSWKSPTGLILYSKTDAISRTQAEHMLENAEAAVRMSGYWDPETRPFPATISQDRELWITDDDGIPMKVDEALGWVDSRNPTMINIVPEVRFRERKYADPMASTVGMGTDDYVVVHEMGHATWYAQMDDGPMGDEMSLTFARDRLYNTHQNSPLMSEYGRTSSPEAHAEAFTEWVNTGGTTNNPVVRDYAAEFGWLDDDGNRIERALAAAGPAPLDGPLTPPPLVFIETEEGGYSIPASRLAVPAATAEFHLQGQHDQATHGNRAGGPSPRARRILAESGDEIELSALGILDAPPDLAAIATDERDNDALWDRPTSKVSWTDTFYGTEGTVAKKHVAKVVEGREAMREGYPPRLYELGPDIYLIADGHHRLAMHNLLESDEFEVVVRQLGTTETFHLKGTANDHNQADHAGGRSLKSPPEAPARYIRGREDWVAAHKWLEENDPPWWRGQDPLDEDGLPKRKHEMGIDWDSEDFVYDEYELLPEEVRFGITMIDREINAGRKQLIKEAIAMNEISVADADRRWKFEAEAGSAAQSWTELPPELYHATSKLSAIEQSGVLKSRADVGGSDATAGLGGGDSDTISFTADRSVAEVISQSLHEVHRAVTSTNEEASAIIRAQAGDWWPDVVTAARRHGGVVDGMPASMEERYELWRSFASQREQHGGVMDPLFFSVNPERLAEIDPADIGVVTVNPVVEGAKGYQMGALGEWRIPTGKAVTIAAAEQEWLDDGFAATTETFHLKGTKDDHDQSTHAGGGTASRPYEVSSDQLITDPLGQIHNLDPFLEDPRVRAGVKFNGPIEVAEQMTMMEHRMITEGLGTYSDSRESNMGSLEARDAIEWAQEMGLQPGNNPDMPLAVIYQAAHIQKNIHQLSLSDFGEYERQRRSAVGIVDEFQMAVEGTNGTGPQYEEALADLTYELESRFGVSPAAGFLGALNRSWAESSQDYLSQAHQMSVANTYGHSFDQSGVPESMDWLRNRGDNGLISGGSDPKLAKDLYSEWQPAFDAAAAANYRFTQRQLERQGVGESDPITVYRGVKTITGTGSLDGPVGTEINPLSSWTTSPTVAHDFGGGGWVFEAEVPRQFVYSTAGISGMGSLPEEEVILTADDLISARVVNRGADGPVGYDQMLDNIHAELAVRVVNGVTIVHVDAEDVDWLKRSGSNDAQFHLQGQHDQQSHGNRSGSTVTAADVAAMTPDQFSELLHTTASTQRGDPEQRMHDIQTAGGGVFSWAAEHVGDLTHRINESGGVFGTEFVQPKVDRALRALTHGYGFEREMKEQIASNIRYREQNPREGISGRAYTEDDVRALGQAYADAHRKIPIYNLPSRFARDAAIAVGEWRFDDAVTELEQLKFAVDSGEAAWKSLISQDATVDYLDRIQGTTTEFALLPGELIGEFHLAGTKDDHDQQSHAGGGGRSPADSSLALQVPSFDDLPTKTQAKIAERLAEITGMSEDELRAHLADKAAKYAEIAIATHGNDIDEIMEHAEFYQRWHDTDTEFVERLNETYDEDLTVEDQIAASAALASMRDPSVQIVQARQIAIGLAQDTPFEITQADIDSYHEWRQKRARSDNIGFEEVDLPPGTYRPSDLPPGFLATRLNYAQPDGDTWPTIKSLNTLDVVKAINIYRGADPSDVINPGRTPAGQLTQLSGAKLREYAAAATDPSGGAYVLDTWMYRGLLEDVPLLVHKTSGQRMTTSQAYAGDSIRRADDPDAVRQAPGLNDLFQSTPNQVGVLGKSTGTYPLLKDLVITETVPVVQATMEAAGYTGAPLTPMQTQAILWSGIRTSWNDRNTTDPFADGQVDIYFDD
jgi:hypothetical protein